MIADRQRPHAIAHAGAFVPTVSQLEVASRVLDTGVAEPSAPRGQAEEAAWPIRYGATVVGALWCHWSLGIPLIPQDVASVLGLAATAAAPAVHEVRERLRTPDAVAATVPDLIGESSAIDHRAAGRDEGRRLSVPGPDRRRERRGEGAGGARRARRKHPARAALLRAELRGDCGRPGRGGAVWSHARRIHRCGRRARRTVRGVAGRHAVPRRGRRVERAGAGQAAAHAAGGRDSPARRIGHPQGRRANCRRHESPIGRGGQRRTVPERSALPPRRPADQHPAAARETRRPPAARAPHLVASRQENRQPRGAVAIGDVAAWFLRLAGQRPRAAERARVGDGRRPATRRHRAAGAAEPHHAIERGHAAAPRSPMRAANSRSDMCARRWPDRAAVRSWPRASSASRGRVCEN